MTFKVGDKVRRKVEWIGVDNWEWGNTVCTVDMIDLAGDLHFDNGIGGYFDNGIGGFWFKNRFEPVEEDQPVTPKSGITSWSDAEIGPFDVSVNCKTDLSAVDTLNRLWFNDPVGQKLNQITLKYQESADMTEDQLVTKILTELQAMDDVTTILISWKHRTNGVHWERG